MLKYLLAMLALAVALIDCSYSDTPQYAVEPKMHLGPGNRCLDYYNGGNVPCEITQPNLKFDFGYHTERTAWRVQNLLTGWVQPNGAPFIDYIGSDGKDHGLQLAVDEDFLGFDAAHAYFNIDHSGCHGESFDFKGLDGRMYTATVKATECGEREASFSFDVELYHP